jgi:hypothetical protein
MYKFRLEQIGQLATEYATHSDFCEIFRNDLTSLYLLAFLLMGTHKEAEQCFVVTLGDALDTTGVFRGWQRSWVRRRLIMNAIHYVFDSPANSGGRAEPWCDTVTGSVGCATVDALTRLTPPLERFVFVMSVLERYSDHECSLLLGRTRRDVSEARVRASRQLSGFHRTFAKGPTPSAA